MARRSQQVQAPSHPQYTWAFDANGSPVPIAEAVRGETYTCPLCHGRMIARLGDAVRHHFAHEDDARCPADAVARAAASRWLAERLRHCLNARQSVTASWVCPLCGQAHTTDLLAGVMDVQEDFTEGHLHADVALLDRVGMMRAAVLATDTVSDASAYSRAEVTLIVIKPVRMWRDALDLPALLSGAAIYGGVCTTHRTAARSGLMSESGTLRQIFLDAVSAPPHRFYGLLDDEDDLSHVLRLGRHRLWLPPAVWQRAVGGTRHSIAPGFSILSQEWPRLDGSTVALYYVTIKDAHAVAIRRFAPGEPVVAQLESAAIRTPRLSALQVARSLAER